VCGRRSARRPRRRGAHPTEEASEVKRYNDASDEPFGGEVSEGETAAAPAAEVDFDEDRPRIDIEAANLAERSIGRP
jgi:hypothetical protein